MDPLFDRLPENLTELSDEQLVELLTSYTEIEARLHTGDAELTGDRTNAEVLAEHTELVEAIVAVRGEQSNRAEEAAATQRAMDELHARVTGEPVAEPEPEAEAETEPAEDAPTEGDPEPEPEAEPVAEEAEAEPIAASGRRPFRTPVVARDRQPDPAEAQPAIVASAELPGVAHGQRLTMHDVANAMINKRRGFGFYHGAAEDVPIAAVYADYPEERRLDMGDAVETWQKIKHVIGGSPGSREQADALAASGGLCAPTVVNYALDVVGATDTPVWDSLPTFQATRGGIRYTYPPTLSDISGAIGVVTADQDKAGGSPAVKGCQVVTCNEFVEVLVDVVYKCLRFGNLQARTYPELVAAWQQVTAVAFANVQEVLILDAIKAGSTKVTTVQPELGAIAEFTAIMARSAAAWRSRWRLNRNARLRVLLPQWLPDLLVADKYKRPFEDFDDNDFTELNALFGYHGLDPVYYMDSSSDGGQVFDAQTTGNLEEFPSDVEWAMYPEGTWIGIDSGQLDLGLVRDSSLNSTNDFEFFMEEFLNAARVGNQSIWGTTPLCVTGHTSTQKDVTCRSVA